MQWFRRFWLRIQSSYWFFPSILCTSALLLGVGLVELDRSWWGDDGYSQDWLARTGADGARAVLTAIAGSMITVAGTVFSITILTLSLASQQFGPRLLRNFMRDRGNQIVLGIFVATFLYCIMVLRTVSGRDEATFIPHFSVRVAVGLAILAVGMLIYFIHHVAISIQAPSIVAQVAKELNEQIKARFPETSDAGSMPSHGGEPADAATAEVHFREHGYVQTIDHGKLVDIAKENRISMSLECSPGNFVAVGECCVKFWPPRELDGRAEQRVLQCFAVGRTPTSAQDPDFAIEQLVEVAIRSLSTGINDPFTAISCVDELGAALAQVASRRPGPSEHRDRDGNVRLRTRSVTLTDLVHDAFGPLRQYAATSQIVALRVLTRLADIGARVRVARDAGAILEEAEWTARYATQHLSDGDPMKAKLERALENVRRSVAGAV